MGLSISGRNIPEFPISIFFFNIGWYPKISIDGSVYGLYAGLNHNLVIPENKNIKLFQYIICDYLN